MHETPRPIRMTMRWFGPHDPVKLSHIRQVPGVVGVVTSVSGIPAGQPWKAEALDQLREPVESAGLGIDVIESIAVSDAVKLAEPDVEAHIEAWCESLRVVADAGIRTVCYNFMPIADWTRTELAHPLADGSTSVAYAERDMPAFEASVRSGEAEHLPAWEHVDAARFDELRSRYIDRGESGLWDALHAFLERVVPVAESLGVRLGIHPDDPCWPVFGLPRIASSRAALKRVTELVDSRSNGVTYCTGSLGCDPQHDLVAGARELGSRVSFLHARNVRTTEPKTFHETAHPPEFGDVHLPAVLEALIESGFEGPARPDHGRAIWGEEGTPAYGLFDRALGATYLLGAIDAVMLKRS